MIDAIKNSPYRVPDQEVKLPTQGDEVLSPGFTLGDGRCLVRVLVEQGHVHQVTINGVTHHRPHEVDILRDNSPETLLFLTQFMRRYYTAIYTRVVHKESIPMTPAERAAFMAQYDAITLEASINAWTEDTSIREEMWADEFLIWGFGMEVRAVVEVTMVTANGGSHRNGASSTARIPKLWYDD